MKQLIVIILLVIQLHVYSQTIPGFQIYAHKQFNSITLNILVKKPANFNEKAEYPTIVFFFGSGLTSFKQAQFKLNPHADYFASRRMITALVD